MTNQAVVRRYARVLYEESATDVQMDMELIRATLDDSRDLRWCLASPVVSRKKKLAVLESVFAAQIHATVLRFVRLLAERNRIALLLPIAHAYREIRDRHLGIVSVDVRVRFALSQDETSELQQTLEAYLGASVRLSVTEDDSLIGGIVLRIGDVVHDGSVTHQLVRLRKKINRQES